MEKGYVVNNTGRAKHAYKKMVYPGQQVDFEYIYKQVGHKLDGVKLSEWLKKNLLPKGWEVVVQKDKEVSVEDYPYKEVLETSKIKISNEVPDLSKLNSTVGDEDSEDDDSPSLEYLPARRVEKLTYKDLYNLRIKDNPKRIIDQIYNINTLRRALTLCKRNGRKATLAKIIQLRIRNLGQTLS